MRLTNEKLLSQDDQQTIQESNGAVATSQAETVTEDGGASLRTTTPHPQSTYMAQSSPAVYARHNGKENGGGVAGNTASWADTPGDAEDDDVSCGEASPSSGVVGANYTKPQPNRPQFDRDS